LKPAQNKKWTRMTRVERMKTDFYSASQRRSVKIRLISVIRVLYGKKMFLINQNI